MLRNGKIIVEVIVVDKIMPSFSVVLAQPLDKIIQVFVTV